MKKIQLPFHIVQVQIQTIKIVPCNRDSKCSHKFHAKLRAKMSFEKRKEKLREILARFFFLRQLNTSTCNDYCKAMNI